MKKPFFLMGLAAFALLPLNVKAAPEDTELHKQMEAMNDAYKAMRKETDPVKGAELAREAQTWAIKSTLEVPQMIKDMKDPAEKAKAEVLYRKMMAKMIISLCEVEEAFQAGKLDKVAEIVEALKADKKEGHEKFKPADE